MDWFSHLSEVRVVELPVLEHLFVGLPALLGPPGLRQRLPLRPQPLHRRHGALPLPRLRPRRRAARGRQSPHLLPVLLGLVAQELLEPGPSRFQVGLPQLHFARFVVGAHAGI